MFLVNSKRLLPRSDTESALIVVPGSVARTVQRCALCRSRRELSNEYLLAKFGFDTAENEPSKVQIT